MDLLILELLNFMEIFEQKIVLKDEIWPVIFEILLARYLPLKLEGPITV